MAPCRAFDDLTANHCPLCQNTRDGAFAYLPAQEARVHPLFGATISRQTVSVNTPLDLFSWPNGSPAQPLNGSCTSSSWQEYRRWVYTVARGNAPDISLVDDNSIASAILSHIQRTPSLLCELEDCQHTLLQREEPPATSVFVRKTTASATQSFHFRRTLTFLSCSIRTSGENITRQPNLRAAQSRTARSFGELFLRRVGFKRLSERPIPFFYTPVPHQSTARRSR